MGRFFAFAFLFFTLLTLSVNAQRNPLRMFPGDRMEETEGSGLLIRSNPSRARIFIDGIEYGYTPLRLDHLRPGRYVVQLRKDGYVERRFTVRVRQGSLMTVSLELQESTGRVLLKISRASGSPEPEKLRFYPRISVDGTSFDTEALELRAGFRNILVSAFGWEDAAATVYVEADSYKELELSLKPAVFKVSGGSQSRSRFNPASTGSLGSTTINFTVSAPGTGSLTVMDPDWKPVFERPLDLFETWSQSVTWNGRNNDGEKLPDGVYTLVISVYSVPWDDSLPVEDGFVIQTELDSSKLIYPLSLSSGKSGLFYAPLPSLLPAGSFQIEGSLLAGSPPRGGEPWTSLPFAVAFRFSPIDRLELSAALNVIARFEGEASAGAGGGVKWIYLDSNDSGLPLDAAAGLVFSWTGKTALFPFGMASGFELYFPFRLNLGRIFSISLSPAALWTGDFAEEKSGFPWEPVPRLLVSGGVMAQMAWFSAGLSVRSEYKFSGDGPWPPYIMTGAEARFFPPPSSFVFSFIGGIWVRGSELGGYGGLGIGMIH